MINGRYCGFLAHKSVANYDNRWISFTCSDDHLSWDLGGFEIEYNALGNNEIDIQYWKLSDAEIEAIRD